MEEKKIKGISFFKTNVILSVFALIIGSILFISSYMLASKYRSMNDAITDYIEWEKDAAELENASDYLTEQVRLYVVVSDRQYLDNYFNEAQHTKRREKSLEHIKDKLADTDAYIILNEAMNKSIALMDKEYHAMKLVVMAKEYELDTFPDEVKNYNLSDEEIALSSQEKLNLASELVFGDEYTDVKLSIKTSVKNCITALDVIMTDKISSSSEGLRIYMMVQQSISLALFIFLVISYTVSYTKVVLPLRRGVNLIEKKDFLNLEGVLEYKIFANEYNEIRKNDLILNEKLIYEAEHDKLTGLYNRTGYYEIYNRMNLNEIAYALIDVDNFKMVNDAHGHAVGDLVLKRVADALESAFSKGNYVFRIGGDEFAVILIDVNDESINKIKRKFRDVSIILSDQDNEIPSVTLSVGIAYGDKSDSTDSLFKKADKALYETKRNGRNGVSIYNKN